MNALQKLKQKFPQYQFNESTCLGDTSTRVCIHRSYSGHNLGLEVQGRGEGELMAKAKHAIAELDATIQHFKGG